MNPTSQLADPFAEADQTEQLLGQANTILSALKADKEEEVRYQAAGALANFDSEDVRKALEASSEDDKSEKVAKRAAEVLALLKDKKLADKEDK